MLLEGRFDFLPRRWFQRAPTLGGECYIVYSRTPAVHLFNRFQRAPTLGGECYRSQATYYNRDAHHEFQRAPTLGGECYRVY